MSASIAIAGAASAQSAANAARIAAEHQARCRTDIADFRPEGASVERMKSYAECVQYMHPDPVSPENVPYIKAGIVALLAAMVVGFWFGATKGPFGDGDGGIVDGISMAVIAPILLVLVGLIVMLVAAGVMYVLS